MALGEQQKIRRDLNNHGLLSGYETSSKKAGKDG